MGTGHRQWVDRHDTALRDGPHAHRHHEDTEEGEVEEVAGEAEMITDTAPGDRHLDPDPQGAVFLDHHIHPAHLQGLRRDVEEAIVGGTPRHEEEDEAGGARAIARTTVTAIAAEAGAGVEALQVGGRNSKKRRQRACCGERSGVGWVESCSFLFEGWDLGLKLRAWKMKYPAQEYASLARIV